MRIGIDARIITKHTTGAGRVFETLVSQLKEYPQYDFFIFHTSDWLAPPETIGDNITLCKLDIPVSTFKNIFFSAGYINKYALDIFYYSFLDLPIGLNAKRVMAVYDLYHMTDRNYFAKGSLAKYWAIKFLTWWRLICSDSLIAISRTTESQIRSLPMLSKKKVHTVNLALFRDPGPNVAPRPIGLTTLSHPYYLYVGNNRNHKNLKTLIQAFSIFQKSCSEKTVLVMCGSIDQRYPNPMGYANYFGCETAVQHLGHIDDESLDYLYSNALALVIPSLYEGFGLPALEGAARGRAVICSDISALKEVLGDAGIYCHPTNIDEWVNVLTEFRVNKLKRIEVAARCGEQAKKFSKQKFASETIRALIESPEDM